MSDTIRHILNKDKLSRADIINLLSAKHEDDVALIYKTAAEIRNASVGTNVYLRGLIEYSNKCVKNCLYCGVRSGNKNVNRFEVNHEEVIECAQYAYDNNYGSVVIQSGERSDAAFIEKIDQLIKNTKKISNGALGITLSCGEQSLETYKRWHNSGATRYLLRIESSNPKLYYKIHPNNQIHNMDERIASLQRLREAGYHVGSGMMIGLPWQQIEDIADDLLFLREIDIDMAGLGPYIEHQDTPLYDVKNILIEREARLELSLRTIALLRIIMNDINIASSTALDTLSPDGRMKAIEAGANVLMPNLTPANYRDEYFLYDGKPTVLEANDLINNMNIGLNNTPYSIAFGELGDSKHYLVRNS